MQKMAFLVFKVILYYILMLFMWHGFSVAPNVYVFYIYSLANLSQKLRRDFLMNKYPSSKAQLPKLSVPTVIKLMFTIILLLPID
jgi:hypothetical protein